MEASKGIGEEGYGLEGEGTTRLVSGGGKHFDT